MRVRLNICRHELPAVKILWTVPVEPTTIAQLLERINETVPLESDGWGIEDYAVEVGGFECVHYQDAQSILKEGDQVDIRALETQDIRVRNISGRHQISSGGVHLIDGIAFGRRPLKRAARPSVFIPPRKRARTEDQTTGAATNGQVNGQGAVATANTDQASQGELRSSKRRKSVSFDEDSLVETVHLSDDGSEDESDDEDFSDSGNSSSSNDENDSDDEDTDSDTSAPSVINHTSRVNGSSGTLKVDSEDDDDEDSESESSEESSSDDSSTEDTPSEDSSDVSEDDSDSDSEESRPSVKTSSPAAPESKGSKAGKANKTSAPPPQVPPGQGQSRTKHRNERRKMSNAMARAKQAGTIAPNTTLIEYRAMLEAAQTAPSALEAEAELTTQSAQAELQAAELTLVNDAGVVDSPARRSRLDLSSARRLMFGSLGLRAPKTKAEEDKLRETLAAKAATKRAPANAGALYTAPAEDEDWRNKIVLSAVECVDKDVHLTPPPFPFQQRWDPQQRTNKKNKKRKKANIDYPPADEEYYDEDYSEYAQLEEDEDLPPIPAFLAMLPAMSLLDARPGVVMVFKQLEVSQATGWQPSVSPLRTAEILEADAHTGSLTVRLAKRDHPEHEWQYDDEGNRVYGKFELAGDEDEGDGEGDGQAARDVRLLELDFGSLIEPKVIVELPGQPPVEAVPKAENTQDVAEDGVEEAADGSVGSDGRLNESFSQDEVPLSDFSQNNVDAASHLDGRGVAGARTVPASA